MKKHIASLLSFLFFSVLHADEVQNLVLLDQIDVVIVGRDATEIITRSDSDRQSLGGGYRTQSDLIFEKEVLLDAKQHQIPEDAETVDAGIAQMQREHNITHEDMENIFKSSGYYNYEEGRQHFQDMQRINTMLDLKVRSNLIIPRKEIEVYYNEHPEFVEATYTLERLFVPFSSTVSKQAQKRTIMRYIKTGKGLSDLQQGAIFTINHSDVAPQKHFIYTMECDSISAPAETAGGFEMFRLITKTPEYRKSLEESYREIADILRRPKYEELLQNYRDQLLKNVSIIYMN